MVEETGDILLILRSPELARLLVIETGPLEGRAIAMKAEGVRSERPLTQDYLRIRGAKLVPAPVYGVWRSSAMVAPKSASVVRRPIVAPGWIKSP